MTTAARSGSVSIERFNSPRTSGLKDDALLARRVSMESAWDALIDDLLRMRELEDDWDGVGAKAPPTVLVDSSLMLARELRDGCRTRPNVFPWGVVPSRIVPGVTGT